MAHTILFTGHMIDKEGRGEPRFPPAKESAVRIELAQRMRKLMQTIKTNLLGIAGGACGGDILFHELCVEMKIPSEIHLAMPAHEFKKHSVSFAGPEWDKRFDQLVNKLPVYILPEASPSSKKNIWAETNLWMLQKTIDNSGSDFTLIALWDGKPGDGEGGTEQMIEAAQEKKARIETIDINAIGQISPF
jgi:hypothetical protein